MGDFSRVTFTARAALGEGEELLVSGSVQALGGFALSQAIPLKRDAVNKTVWKTVRPVVVPRGVRFRYKYVGLLHLGASSCCRKYLDILDLTYNSFL